MRYKKILKVDIGNNIYVGNFLNFQVEGAPTLIQITPLSLLYVKLN